MQRPQFIAAPDRRLGRLRLDAGAFGADGDKGVQLGAFLDPLQGGVDRLDRGNPACGNLGRQGHGAQVGNLGHGRSFRLSQILLRPPWMAMVWPVMNRASSEAR